MGGAGLQNRWVAQCPWKVSEDKTECYLVENFRCRVIFMLGREYIPQTLRVVSNSVLLLEVPEELDPAPLAGGCASLRNPCISPGVVGSGDGELIRP